MSDMVNLVLPGGQVVSVPKELAEAALGSRTAHLESTEEATTRDTKALNEERSAGLAEGLKAGAEGFADAASFGLVGKALQAGDEDYERNSRIRAGERGGSRLAGELAAFLTPEAPANLLAGAVGKVVGQAVGKGVNAVREARAGAAAAKVGTVAEEAVGATTAATTAGEQLALPAGETALARTPGTAAATTPGQAIPTIRAYPVQNGTWAEEQLAAGEGLRLRNGPQNALPPGQLQLPGEVVTMARTGPTGLVAPAAEGVAEAGTAPGIGALPGEVAPTGIARGPGVGLATTDYMGERALVAAQDAAGSAAPGTGLAGEATVEAAQSTLQKEMMSGTARLLAEGAAYGIGGSVADSNVSGDPLTIEGVISAAGMGAILNLGLGKIAEGLTGVSQRAAKEVAAEHDYKSLKELFDSNPASYDNLWQAHKDAIAANKTAIKEYQRAVSKSEEDISKFYNSDSYTSTLKKFNEIYLQSVSKLTNSAALDNVQREALQNVVTALDKGRDALRQIVKNDTGDVKGIVAAMRGVTDDIRQKLPVAFRESPEEVAARLKTGAKAPKSPIPNLPYIPKPFDGPVPPEIKVSRLPNTLRGFAKMLPEDVASLANAVKPGSPLAQEIQRFTSELGMTAGAGEGATLAQVHAGLKNMYQGLQDAARSITEPKNLGNTILSSLRRTGKYAVRLGVGREADIAVGRGFLGAASRVIAGAGVGYALDGVEGAVIGASLLTAKAHTTDRITRLMAEYGQGAAKALRGIGPVTSYLGQSLVTGEKDDDGSHTDQALRRVNEMMSLYGVANDASYTAVQPLLTMENDIAYKMHLQMMSMMNYMMGTVPRDNGLATNMWNSYWRPSPADAYKLAGRLEAMQNPINAMTRLLHGDGSPESADAMWNMWGEHMQLGGMLMAQNWHNFQDLSREQTSALSRMFRIPLSGFAQGPVVAQLQSLYLPQQPQGNSRMSIPAGVGGRPPAVNSPDPNQSRVSQLMKQ